MEDDDKIKRVILCSGKVYYDLFARRQEAELDTVVIIRIEQLYPFPVDELQQQVNRYKNAETFIWCQEEPMNQGAWYSSQHHMRAVIGKQNHLEYAGRPFLAAPAEGNMTTHKLEQAQLVNEALGLT
jgi:2-oxoglutarate dehydrogenase E1 component